MKNKMIIYGVIFALLVLIFDLATRVLFQDVENVNKDIALPSLEFQTKTAAIAKDVWSMYSQYDIVKPKPKLPEVVKKAVIPIPKVIGIGIDKENQQNGRLNNLFFGENKISLSGIFSNDARFAIVKIHNLSNKADKLKKIQQGQMLFDYQVNQINTKSIKLLRNAQVVELKLFENKS
jgi:hypothetical protein